MTPIEALQRLLDGTDPDLPDDPALLRYLIALRLKQIQPEDLV